MSHNLIGERLSAQRNLREWSQVELAKRSGVSQAQISLLESGERTNPGVLTLNALEQALGLEHGTLSRPETKAKRARKQQPAA
jgi:transcriptional regulator with XRE-family HTH domain